MGSLAAPCRDGGWAPYDAINHALKHGSGDIFLTFVTGNPGAFSLKEITTIKQFPNEGMNPFFTAVGEATEEAILNALVAGRDMTSIEGNSVRGLPKKEVQDFLREHALLK
jgi:D-aminopeptidase